MKKLLFILLLSSILISYNVYSATLCNTFSGQVGNTEFDASEAAEIANYDLVLAQRRAHDSPEGSGWSYLKGLNASILIFLYENGIHVSNADDATITENLDTLGRWDNDRDHSDGDLNTDNTDYFCLDDEGDRQYHKTYTDNYLMAFSGVTTDSYLEYWLEAVNTDIIYQTWNGDGIFVDDCTLWDDDNISNWRTAANDPSTMNAAYDTGAEWNALMEAFIEGVASGVTSEDVIVNAGNSRYSLALTSWRNINGSGSEPFGMLEEGFVVVEYVAAGDEVQFYPEADWKRQVDNLATMDTTIAIIQSSVKLLEAGSGNDNYDRDVTFYDAFWYGLCSYLMGKRNPENSYFGFVGDPNSYSTVWWQDEYNDIDLGDPVSPYTSETVDGLTVYKREYDNGWVFVNPDSNNGDNGDGSVTGWALPEQLKIINHDNFQSPPGFSSTLDLGSHRGVIGLKGTNPPGAPLFVNSGIQGGGSVTVSGDAGAGSINGGL